jgi:hypothetical protein
MSSDQLKRSISSRDMLVAAGKEVAKSVVVAKAAEVGAKRLGLAAAASTAGTTAWGASLLMARYLHPQYLDPVSSNQINRDPEFVMNCHMLLPTRDEVKIEKVHELFEWYVQTYARFRERVVVRRFLWPYWEPVAKVDLHQHISFDATEMNHGSLQDYVSKSLTQGMNPLIPLWRLVIFSNFTFEDGSKGSYIFFKFHHCMGDGFSIAKTLFTGATDRSEAPPKPVAKTVHQPGQFGKAVNAAVKLVTIQDDAPSTVKAQTLLKPLDDRIACFLNSRVPISEIKKAAKTKGCTINDMVLACLSASLRNYKKVKEDTITDPLAAVWVAFRPLSEAFEPFDPKRIEEPGNSTLGCVYVRMPVADDFANRADRVDAVVNEIGKLKGSPEPIFAQGFMQLFGLLPSALTNPIWNALSNKVSISISNVPGPPIDFTWFGVRPEGLSVFVPPVGTISTFCVVTSYVDRLTISLALDGSLFTKEDADLISKEFDKEMLLLTSSMAPSRL